MMSALLNTDVRKAAQQSVLCWLATVDASGQPNVSPKEIFAVTDDEHIVVANIASPVSARNIAANPKVCLSFIDILVQKGFKVTAVAKNVTSAMPEFEDWVKPLRAMAGPRFPIQSVFVLNTVNVQAIVAPSYGLFPAETSEAQQIQSALHAYGLATPRQEP